MEARGARANIRAMPQRVIKPVFRAFFEPSESKGDSHRP
jgi:hypothetical protein